MALNLKWTRRTFMGSLGAIAGTMLSSKKLFGKVVLAAGKDAPKVSGFGESGNVYEELGVSTVINGQGPMSVLGCSLARPEVEAVMGLAGRHFCSIPDLEVAAGNRIGEMLKLPDGYGALVTSGAAAAKQSGLAGLLTGDNPEFIGRPPHP